MNKKIYIPTADEDEEEFFISFCERLEIKLKDMEKDTNTPAKIYFASEFDSQQSKFEKASNNLEVCVIAKNQTVALVLLRLTRFIFENSVIVDRILTDLQSPDNKYWGKSISIRKIIEVVSQIEQQYHSFNIGDELEVTLKGWDLKKNKAVKKRITKDISEVDIYTLSRVIKELEM